MSNTPGDDEQSLLRSAGYTPETPPTPGSTTLRPPNSRRRFQRMDSSGPTEYNDPAPRYSSPVSAMSNFETFEAGTAGLGIRPQSIQRVPVGSRISLSNPFEPSSSRSTPGTPGLTNPFENPYIQNASGTPRSEDEEDITKGKNIFSDSPELPFVTIDEVPRVTPLTGTPMSMNNENDNDNDNLKPYAERLSQSIAGCPANHDIHSHRYSWLSISILMLSIYSTIFSGIWLVLALAQPRYGRAIHSGGKLSPSTASIVFALFAKTIELSFVTVFITFLGQVLSRRSLVKSSRGVTIAEMTMRTWVIQPGFMITHFQNLQHAGLTFLGVISLTAALVSMFYTTASDAIVSPQLRFDKTKNTVMYGLVQASYANPIYIEGNCKTPISKDVDPDGNAGLTCLAYENAGQSYHNAISFLSTWGDINAEGAGVSTNIADRPAAPGMLFDNTTVVGSWVAANYSNITSAYEKYSRIVNNVTLSMPHAGLFAAARASKNGILQPEELAGVGEYNIEASVISPTVNVLCANMNKTEVAPLIYTTWPHATVTNSSSMPGQVLAWPGYQDDIQLLSGQQYLNSTAADDVFEWGQKYKRQPPVFPMVGFVRCKCIIANSFQYPIEYNSLTNISVYMSDSVYMLIKAPDASTADYTMCQLRSYQSTSCSSFYNVSGLSDGQLESHCDDPNNLMAYNRSVQPAPETWNKDWRNVAQEWILSLSLNTGLSDANSSTSRLLSQLIPTAPSSGLPTLPVLTPSISELLAVMAGSTLMDSTSDSTFYHYWTYPANILDPGEWEPFNASISSQQYTSGLQQQWQGIFYVVLLLVFVTNVFCLVYFILRHGLVTDYTEPSNLFALAVNSPPSHRLDGSCGAGPEGHQLDVDWHVMAENSSGHFFIREGQQGVQDNEFELRRRSPQNLKSITSYSKLSAKRNSFL
ncbi:uncharacterized protein LY89DRAFT_225149 [Mollisia scopiformis]|uniref:Mcm2 3 5 family protein n=1 Tax=Mollisia scopiformis TaxID=149040 RepID=A0A194WUY1_MOLSC|nr:uncharacterized protein LY89DRAFT_225149 [Mollisia scopiformis]KUJ11412.1 hypothetical protein LY89DRAFT_225149 [Mollisia scopiformis]